MDKYCNNCGKELDPSINFCSSCGKKKKSESSGKESNESSIPPWAIAGCLVFATIMIWSLSNEWGEDDSMAVEVKKSELKEYFENSDVEAGNSDITLPSFEVVEEETQDTPIKTQVEQHILVKDHIQPKNLRALLNDQYDEISSRSGYQHRDRVTNAYIYVYDSDENADQKGYFWIASLQKGFDDSPRIQIKEDQIEINKQKPESKFGFSESKRKEIFKKLVSAEAKARKDAIAREPDDWEKQIDLEDNLKDQYTKQLAQEYAISSSIIDSITIEGVTKQWPQPDL